MDLTSKPRMRTFVGWLGVGLVWLLTATAGVASQAPASQAPAQTGSLSGRVLDAATGLPMAGIVVRLSPDPRRPAGGQVTGADGRFDFRQLPSGAFQIEARSGGTMNGPNGFIQNSFGFPIGQYINGGFGQTSINGPLEMIMLAEGERRSGLDIRLWRGGVIAGRVTDEAGDPLVDVLVGAVRVAADGRLADGPTGKTNDLGEYRLSALTPGAYVVFVPQTQSVAPWSDVETALERLDRVASTSGQALPVVPELTGIRIGETLVSSASRGMITGGMAPRVARGGVFVYPTTFAPAADTIDSASPVRVGPGEERGGVDVVIRGVRGAPVSGVVSFGGAPAAGMPVRLVPASAGSSLFEVAETQSDAQGRFTFPVVPVGAYVVIAEGDVARPAVPGGVVHDRGVAGGPGAWARVPVSVDERGLADLAVALRSGVPVRGQVVFDGAGTPPTAAQLRNAVVSLRTARPVRRVPPQAPSAAIEADLRFVFAGVEPGRYVFRPPAVLAGWRLASIDVQGQSVAEWPIDVSSELSAALGNVVVRYRQTLPGADVTVTGSEAELASSVVVVYPAARTAWPDLYRSGRVRVAKVPANGRVVINDLFDGDYLVAAIPAELATDFLDGAVFDRVAVVASALRVPVDGRAAASVSVRRPR